MFLKRTVIGFSGHRSLADEKPVAEGIRGALDRLKDIYGPMAAVSSAASGADTLFVEEVIRRKLPYLLILPFPKDRFRKDFSTDGWLRLIPYFNGATQVVELSGTKSDGDAYMEAGMGTVDRAGVMIVVWNGLPAAGLGGTGDVVSYARKLRKPLLVVDPENGRISAERLEQLPTKAHPRSRKHFQEQRVNGSRKNRSEKSESRLPDQENQL